MAITSLTRKVAGKLGSAIDTVGTSLGNPFGQGVKGIDISSTLQNYGGNMAGSIKNAIVPQAYAGSGALPSSAKNYSQQVSSYQPQQVQKVGGAYPKGPSSSTNVNSGGGDSFSFDTNLPSPDQPFSGGGGGSEIDMINDQFNQFNSYLDTQSNQAQSNFNETVGMMDTQKANQEKLYSTEKATQTEGVKKSEALNLAQVRQLLSDLQQKDAARTAIAGGGSTSEALAERFGREAQSRLGNVQDQTRQAIERVNQFYDRKLVELNDSYTANVFQAKQTLQDNLSYIQQQRVGSAQAKQNATMNAWRSYYDQVNQAKVQAATFKAQMDMWKQQQDSANAAIDPFNAQNASVYNQGLQGSYSQMDPVGIQQQQQQSMNPNYRMFSPQPGQEDEEAKAMGLNYSPAIGSQITR